ncbi:ATP-dependent DNA helicase DinG [Niallia nealsonii]|uniref:3'-5' exonuclease DinG n=1 Tax=Niallia nealsonii TaxID=115979 RepID=A0A2N0Z3K8_9BACI|nr:ATP-dependent DNA helicase DinG [Niallia nealsonii]PKG24101.1 ATP-dependent helicase DinG [Niallia nealsonii]
MENKYVVIDLETNGNSPKKGDRIIQFAAVVVMNGEIVEEYSSLINPLQPISPFIEELTGINDEMVKDAPLFEEIAEKVQELLKDAYFVAHNVLFDLSFLSEELEQAFYKPFYGPVLDTVELARVLFPTADSYKLTDLALQEGIVHSRPHQADSDAYVTAELLLILLHKLEGLPLQTNKQLHKLSGSLKSDIDLLLEDIMDKKQKKVEYIPDHLEVYRGLALKIIKNEEKDNREKRKALQNFSITEIEKQMERALPFFRKRQGQLKMMETIYEAFCDNNHRLIEAGTGIGKSLAYLLPAAYFAFANKKQIVISTYTTQLQEQLINKELPLLKSTLPFFVSYTILKGRSHYISLDKFEISLQEKEDNYDTILTKMQILIWLTETSTGDKDELNLSSGGAAYWNKIKNDGNFSLAISKAWAPKDFYRRTRLLAQKAHLIITNHALLLKDSTSLQKSIPAYQYAVIDEGHHFEKVATKHFGHKFSYVGVKVSIQQVGTFEQKQLYYKMELFMDKEGKGQKDPTFNRLIGDLQIELDSFFRTLMRYAKKPGKKTVYTNNAFRIKREDTKEWSNARNSAERLVFLFKDAIDAITAKINRLKQSKEILTTKQVLVTERLAEIQKEWQDYLMALRIVFLREEKHISWLEADIRTFPNNAVLFAQPYSVGEILQKEFFAQKNSIVFTSATLTVNNSFDYYVRSLGLIAENYKAEQIISPFPYEKQVKLLVPNDIPEINTVPLEEFIAAITEQIIQIAEATAGRMLILFTANDMLRKTHDLIKESGCLEDFAILAQGITNGSRMRLTRNFQRYEKAILLGTNSFWEGIDIPGEDLSCLVIVRLPFSSPDEPLTEAKNEEIKKNGGNPFTENSLPEAVLRFKQGFGRLIRTEEDKGFIVVFDRRILTTTYGETFLRSIPAVSVETKKLNEMIAVIKKWL